MEMSGETPRRRLGRGLSALLGGNAPAHESSAGGQELELRPVAMSALTRSPWQARKEFDPEAIGELADSIREHGVLQPLLVREADGGFQIIAGERRWLAAQKAGLETIPCRIIDVIDKTACEFSLEENLKRKDLSDLEKAAAFKEYLVQFQCSVEELAKQLSMSRSAVSNILRLLDLTEPARNALAAGKISAGHARALLPLEAADQLALCGRIQAETLNVRQTEQAVKVLLGRTTEPAPIAAPTHSQAVTVGAPIVAETSITEPGASASQTVESAPAAASEAPAAEAVTAGPADVVSIATPVEVPSHVTNHVRDLEGQLRNVLGAAVEIRLTSKDSGQIVIPFGGNAEFERILGVLRSRAAA